MIMIIQHHHGEEVDKGPIWVGEEAMLGWAEEAAGIELKLTCTL
jgi:hypothetical protein